MLVVLEWLVCLLTFLWLSLLAVPGLVLRHLRLERASASQALKLVAAESEGEAVAEAALQEVFAPEALSEEDVAVAVVEIYQALAEESFGLEDHNSLVEEGHMEDIPDPGQSFLEVVGHILFQIDQVVDHNNHHILAAESWGEGETAIRLESKEVLELVPDSLAVDQDEMSSI